MWFEGQSRSIQSSVRPSDLGGHWSSQYLYEGNRQLSSRFILYLLQALVRETWGMKGLLDAGSFMHKTEYNLKHMPEYILKRILVKLCLFYSRCTARCTVRQSLHIRWEQRLVLTCACAAFRLDILRGAVRNQQSERPKRKREFRVRVRDAKRRSLRMSTLPVTWSRGRLLSLAPVPMHSALGRDRPGEKQFDVVPIESRQSCHSSFLQPHCVAGARTVVRENGPRARILALFSIQLCSPAARLPP